MKWEFYRDGYFLLILLLLLIVFVLNCFVGSAYSILDYPQLNLEERNLFWEMVYNYRLPRALSAIVTGVALSSSGWILQEYFRNPLAGPSILGVTSFAGLGVAVSIVLASFFGFSICLKQPFFLIFSAFMGASLALLIVLFFSSKTKSVSAMLLIGFMLSGLAGAVISLLQFYATVFDLKSLMLWSFGSISGLLYSQIWGYASVVFMSLLLIFKNIKELQKLQLGYDYAHAMGVDIKKIQLIVVFTSGLMTASVTALVGPIAFVGIAIPHLVKISLKTANFKKLLTYVIFIGAITLLCFSFLSENLLEHTLPINIISAFLGAPILIWVIFKNRNKML